jgi:hypothetical protein
MVRSGFRLTSEEIEHFRTEGYLVLRRVLDPAGCERAVDRVWDLLPKRFRRDSPFTWRGAVSHGEDRRTLRQRGGRVLLRLAPHGASPEDEAHPAEEFARLLPRNPIVHSVAEEVLGHGEVADPQPPAGIYPIFPLWSLRRRRPEAHVDRHVYQLGALAYLEQVRPGGGAFTLWPRSHVAFHPLFARHVGDGPLPGFEQARREWSERPGLEVTGHAGDVIFYHHRLLHSPGQNRGRHVRQALVTEFSSEALASSLHEPPPDDMWWYWSGLKERVIGRELVSA